MAVAASLSVRISANTTAFQKELQSMERRFVGMGSRLQAVGVGLTAAITLPLVAMGVAATKFSADFEKSMTKLVTLSGVSEAQMRSMRQAVLEMAPAVGIGPRALTEGLLVVTSTGFEGARALDVLELSAKSSAIGMGETKDVARALTAAISAYGEENLTAAAAADILHQTVLVGGAEANELAGEIGRVIGVASQLGVNFAEVGAFIATYTRLGLTAAEATTGLSGALNTILNPSQEARKALADIGLSADELRQMVAEQGLGGALIALLGRLGGNADAIGAVFGNVRALAGVMGTAGVQADAYRDNLDAITNSAGSLNAAFERTKETTAFKWEQLKARAEAVAIAFGDRLAPSLNRVMDAAMPILEAVGALIGRFSTLPQPVQTAALAVLAVAAALGPLVVMAGSLVKGFGLVVGLFGTLSGVTGALATTWTTVVSVFTVVSSIVGGLVTVFGGWAVLLGGVVIAGITAVLVKTGALQSVFGGLWEVLKFVGGILLDVATIIGITFLDNLATLWGWLSKIGSVLVGGLVDAFVWLKDTLIGLIPDAVLTALAFVRDGFLAVRDAVAITADEMQGSGLAPNIGAAPGFAGTTTEDLLKTRATGEQALKAFEDQQRRRQAVAKEAADRVSEEAKRAAEAWKKEIDKLSGREAIRVADEWIRKVEAVGGATKLAATDQQAFNAALEDGIDAMIRLGQAVDPAMFDQWLRSALPVVKALGAGSVGAATFAQSLPGTAVQTPTMTDLHLTQLPPVTGGLPGGLPSVPLPFAPPPPSVWRQIGLDLTNTGSMFGRSLMDAVFAQGDRLRTFFRSLAGNFGDFIGTSLSGILKNAMQSAGNFFSKGLGKFLGGALQSILPGLGGLLAGLIDKIAGLFDRNKGRDLVKQFASTFGGFDNLQQQLLQIPNGEELWKQLTQGVGRNNPEQAQAAIDKVTAALERYKQALKDAMDALPAGAIARSANITDQHDFSTVAAEAMGAFQFMVQQGQSAVGAFAAIAPAVEAMRAAMEGNNFQMTAAAERLFALHDILAANKVQFDNLAASGSILSAMLAANIADGALFSAVALDIGTQIQKIIDNGVPMAQVFALAQPQLQALWEAQKQWGFAVDETTAGLLAEAEAQGFVGEHMKDINQKILDVLIAIGDVLGAQIPDALRGLPAHAQAAADGMQQAFDGVKGPTIPGMTPEQAAEWIANRPPPEIDILDVPQLARGGIVRAQPGGTLVNVGEGGQDEAVVPLGQSNVREGLPALGGGDVYLDGELVGRIMLQHIADEAQRLGVS